MTDDEVLGPSVQKLNRIKRSLLDALVTDYSTQVSIDGDGDVLISIERPQHRYQIIVSTVDEGDFVIMTYWGLEIPLDRKSLCLVNTLNEKQSSTTFYIKDNRLVGRSYLPFTEHLTSTEIILAYRRTMQFIENSEDLNNHDSVN